MSCIKEELGIWGEAFNWGGKMIQTEGTNEKHMTLRMSVNATVNAYRGSHLLLRTQDSRNQS